MKDKDKHSNQLYILVGIAVLLIISLIAFLYIIFQKNNEKPKIKTINKLSIEDSTPKDELKYVNKDSLPINKDVQKNLINPKVDDYIRENNLGNKVGIFAYSVAGDEKYTYNEGLNFSAIGIYKIPLAMVWYDIIELGQYSLTDKLLFESKHFEAGGKIGNLYSIGETIDIGTLLQTMIVEADNSAARILYDGLGGWYTFRQLISKYSSSIQDSSFFGLNNVMNVSYVNDVLYRLYDNPKYNTLIANMQKINKNNYLQSSSNIPIAQISGKHGSVLNVAGIVYAKKPYAITILSTLGDDGLEHIKNINKLFLDYYNK